MPIARALGLVAVLLGALLMGSTGPLSDRACAANPNPADQQRQREQQLQADRARLDTRIQEGQRRLQAAADEQNRLKQSIPNEQQKIKAAEAAAEQMKPEVETRLKAVEELRVQYKAVDERVQAARDKLEQVTTALEQSQPDDSPLARTRSRYKAAREAYQAEVDRVLATPEYKAAYAQATEVGDRVRMADVRSTFLDADAQVGKSFDLGRQARDAYESIRDKLVYNDDGWKAASEELKKVRAEAAEVRQKGAAAVKRVSEARRKYNELFAAAKRSHTMVQQGQAMIQRLDQARGQITSQIQQLQQQRDNLR